MHVRTVCTQQYHTFSSPRACLRRNCCHCNLDTDTCDFSHARKWSSKNNFPYLGFLLSPTTSKTLNWWRSVLSYISGK